jgi:hypothetical protein
MNVIQKIEKVLGVKLEKKLYGKSYDANQKNTYSLSNERIGSLRLDDVVITDFSKLFPYLKSVRSLTINNSTIPDFFELLDLTLHDLVLDNVVIKDNKCEKKGILPWHLKFINMEIDASCLRCFKESNIKGFKQVEFKKCHIDNIQYLNDIMPVSLLILDEITFTHKHIETTKKKTGRLNICNSNFKDVSFFPFQDSLVGIEFENCKIGSIAGLSKFPKFRSITIDSDSKVSDKSIQKNPRNKKMYCTLNRGKKLIDVRLVASLANFIEDLELNNFKGKKIDFIAQFKKVKQLTFTDSKIYVDAFLPIAKQIKSMSITNSWIKKQAYFKHFKNLTNLSAQYYGDDGVRLKSFKKIHPLRKQLKILDICDFEKIADSHLIADFKALKELKIAYGIPVSAARQVLTLKNLKKLSLSVNDKKRTLNLKNLKKLSYLILESRVNFIGFEHLKKLKSLKLGEDMSKSGVDINLLPKMKSLKRLNMTDYNTKIKGMSQFPNLEYLRIKGCPKLKIEKLDKLKVLDLCNAGITNFSAIKKLPSLERLDLSSMYSKIDLNGMDKFPNLKALTLLESDLNDISDLECLKKLEYLDLYGTSVSDVRVLNTLPNLKEVNIATYSNENLEAQLDKPEVAVYCGLPTIYLSIWKKDKFGI